MFSFATRVSRLKGWRKRDASALKLSSRESGLPDSLCPFGVCPDKNELLEALGSPYRICAGQQQH
jgi:hypothetical protein